MAVKIFFGNDIKLLRKTLGEHEEALLAQYPELEIYAPENPNLGNLLDKLSSGSLFAQKELIKLYEFDKITGLEKIAPYVSSDQELFLISYKDKVPAKLVKALQAISFDCKLPESYQLEKILQKEMAGLANADVIRFLAYNITSLVGIEEIKAQLKKRNIKQLDMQTLYLLQGDLQAQVFLIVEDILEKKVRPAILQVNQYLDAGGKLPGLLINLGSQLIKLLKLKEAGLKKGDDELAAKLEISPKIVWKYKKLAGSYQRKDLAQAVRVLPQLELKTRQNQSMQRYYIEKFILELSAGAPTSL